MPDSQGDANFMAMMSKSSYWTCKKRGVPLPNIETEIFDNFNKEQTFELRNYCERAYTRQLKFNNDQKNCQSLAEGDDQCKRDVLDLKVIIHTFDTNEKVHCLTPEFVQKVVARHNSANQIFMCNYKDPNAPIKRTILKQLLYCGKTDIFLMLMKSTQQVLTLDQIIECFCFSLVFGNIDALRIMHQENEHWLRDCVSKPQVWRMIASGWHVVNKERLNFSSFYGYRSVVTHRAESCKAGFKYLFEELGLVANTGDYDNRNSIFFELIRTLEHSFCATGVMRKVLEYLKIDVDSVEVTDGSVPPAALFHFVLNNYSPRVFHYFVASYYQKGGVHDVQVEGRDLMDYLLRQLETNPAKRSEPYESSVRHLMTVEGVDINAKNSTGERIWGRICRLFPLDHMKYYFTAKKADLCDFRVEDYESTIPTHLWVTPKTRILNWRREEKKKNPRNEEEVAEETRVSKKSKAEGPALPGLV